MSNKAGWPFNKTSGFPGIHGTTVLGMHGMGCNRPKLAAVAAATVGLANERHIPNGAMFTIGL